MIRQGRSVDVPARIAALLDQVGCVVQHGHQALLTAREAPWTLDEGEERYQHLRFLCCGHAKCATHVALNAAVV